MSEEMKALLAIVDYINSINGTSVKLRATGGVRLNVEVNEALFNNRDTTEYTYSVS